MAKVLVTGASGFIGWHLVRALAARGDDVACLVRRSSRVDRLEPLGVRLAYGDITDRESLGPATQGKDVVFQLAGRLRALKVEEFHRVNAEGVGNVARACAEQDHPPVLIIVSSLAACGPAVDNRPRREDDPLVPVSNYGRSKLAGEEAARKWAAQMPVTIIRPPIVVGEADPAMREVMAPVARLGIHIVPSWRDHRFSIIHAEDLARLLILAAERGTRLAGPSDATQSGVSLASPSYSRGCYFAACGEDPTYAQLGRMMGEALGRRNVRIVRTGPVVVWTVAGVSQLVSHLSGHPHYFDLDKAREARAGSWTCSPDAAARDLGFHVKVPLLERLRQTAEWYRQSGWL